MNFEIFYEMKFDIYDAKLIEAFLQMRLFISSLVFACVLVLNYIQLKKETDRYDAKFPIFSESSYLLRNQFGYIDAQLPN